MDSKIHLELIIRSGHHVLERIMLKPGSYSIGQSESCSLCIENEELGDLHATLQVGDGLLEVIDHGSEIGTFADGEPVQGSVTLSPPVTLTLGSCTLELLPTGDSSRLNPMGVEDLLDPTVSLESMLTGEKHEMEGLLRQGAMGAIQVARDTRLHRQVAMKVILGEEATPRQLRRFIREAKVLAVLDHPNIVPVYDLGQNEAGRWFYTMKYVRGHNLKDILRGIRSGDAETMERFPLSELLIVFQKVCDAVSFAHARGVLHRDLKPENVMVGFFGEVLVMDWGLAKWLDEGLDPGEDVAARVGQGDPETEIDRTLEGHIMGTPQYMAPEQAEGRGHEVDERADIYSLGAMLYQILTLWPPIRGGTVDEILWKTLHGKIQSPVTYNRPRKIRTTRRIRRIKPGGNSTQVRREDVEVTTREVPVNLPHCPKHQVPTVIASITMKALALKPSDRYRSVRELQKAVRGYQRGLEHWLASNRIQALAATCGILILFGFLTYHMVTGALAANRVRALRPMAQVLHESAERLLVEEEQHLEALEQIQRALVLAPREPAHFFLQGQIYESMLRYSPAVESYSKVLSIDPDFPGARERLETCETARMDSTVPQLSTPEAPGT